MCGISGFLDFSDKQSSIDLAQNLEKMTSVLQHRGPDDGHLWIDENPGIYLGHRRLSIIDLSTQGAQPMLSGSGRFVISYNGEIYNFLEIRKDLQAAGVVFKSNTDTEVLLEACEYYGIEKALNKLVGMFAIAIWDIKQKKLFLARDRVGIKPLYWGVQDGLMLFASELKAIRAFKGLNFEVNIDSLSDYFRFNYIPAPKTIYKNIFKLKPGHLLEFDCKGNKKETCYWDLYEKASCSRLASETQTIVADFESLLADAVSRRMISDVPLGTFLSGGIDSTLVTSIMQSQSTQAVKTFTIGFNEDGYDEAAHAGKIARHLGTEHTELYLSHVDAMDIIPSLSEIYDEPFSDSSQIPSYLVSKMTRQHVTVALSGDGGDECYSGYTRYLLSNRIQKLQKYLPSFATSLLGKGILSCPPAVIDQLSGLLPVSRRPYQAGHRLHKLAEVISMEPSTYYQNLVSHWQHPDSIINKDVSNHQYSCDEIFNRFESAVDSMRYLDQMSYLPDDILTKIDRASMAVSLEARVPLLDHRLIEFSWQLPAELQIRNGKGKWILREVLNKYIPENLMNRPKTGFSIPLDQWLRGPLKEWAASYLNKDSLQNNGYLNADPILRKWQEHLDGKVNAQYLLWDVLMFQTWTERWL